jgi:hypothetical protein
MMVIGCLFDSLLAGFRHRHDLQRRAGPDPTWDCLTIPLTSYWGWQARSSAFLWRHLGHVSAGTTGFSAGLARCHDTDDTNRGSGDTRTIRWIAKMEVCGLPDVHPAFAS